MIPVNQKIIHNPEQGQFGDCYRACVASILELEIEQVPHFMRDTNRRKRIKAILNFLFKYGYTLYTVEGLADCTLEGENEYYIVSGISSRDHTVNHAVVGHKGEIVHDPHPDKSGLYRVSYSEIFLKL